MSDYFDEQASRARDWMLVTTGGFFDGFIRPTAARSPRLGSPLERAFLVWFTAYASVFDQPVGLVEQHEVPAPSGRTYRIDFTPCINSEVHDPVLTRIAVELDGHTFHEKTIEQVTARNERDRALQAAGWTVLHFSFAEFTANPTSCCQHVCEAALAWYRSEQQDGRLELSRIAVGR
jgi:hypothetical protein